MTIQSVRSDAVAPPVGPFSHAIGCGGLIFVSGQVGLDSSTGQLANGGVEAQAEQIFRNLQAVLAAAGKSFDDVLSARVFLTDMGDFDKLNAVYAKHFKEPYPARTTVQVGGLPLGAVVEIDLVARG